MNQASATSTSIVRALAGALLVLASYGCVGLTRETNSVSLGSGNGFAVFKATFYSFATSNCSQCHGATQAPLFAVSDAATAYNAARAAPYADFTSPSDSLLVQYAGNGHCGKSSCSGGSQSATALSMMTTWAAAELAGQQAGANDATGELIPASPKITYLTTPLAIPSPLPLPSSSTKFAIMRWPLSNVSPADPIVGGGYFELQIQQLTPATYRLVSPKLAVSSGPIKVVGVHVLIKHAGDPGIGGEYPLGTEWTAINTTAAAIAIPNPLPATSLAAAVLSPDGLPLPVLSASDVLTIGFESFAVGQVSLMCKNLSGTNGFVANVKPQMQSSCFNCHLSGGSGYGVFPMVSGNDAALCATSLQFVNLNNPGGSELVLRPQGGSGHPNLLPAFMPQPFIDWVNTEK